MHFIPLVLRSRALGSVSCVGEGERSGAGGILLGAAAEGFSSLCSGAQEDLRQAGLGWVQQGAVEMVRQQTEQTAATANGASGRPQDMFRLAWIHLEERRGEKILLKAKALPFL